MSGQAPAGPDLTESLRNLIEEETSHNRALGIRLLDVGRATATCIVVGQADPDTGAVPAGVVTSLTDVASGAAVCMRLGHIPGLATLSLRLDWMRPATAGGTLTARAECFQLGEAVAFVRAIAHEGDPDDPVAAAQGTFMVDRGASPPSSPPREWNGQRPAAPPILHLATARMKLERQGDDLVCRMVYAPDLLGFSALHGGAVAALVESAASLEMIARYPGEPRPSLVSHTIEYLRPGRPEDALARAQVLRRGRRTALVRSEAWQDDQTGLIATGHAVFALAPAP